MRKQMACSKLWTDLQIRFPDQKIGTCCKSVTYSSPTPQQMKQWGASTFTHTPEILADKKMMVEKNTLPPGCHQCTENWPHSYWQEWNTWQNRTWTPEELEELPQKDHSYRIDVYLSNTCNLSCMYCSPVHSSTWARIINKTKEEKETFGNEEWSAQAINVFMDYLDTVGDRFVEITFVGGEPFLDSRLIHFLEEAMVRRKGFERKTLVYIISNLSYPSSLIERYLKVVRSYPDVHWEICPSLDNFSKDSLEIRDGVNLQLFEANLDLLLQGKVKICFGPTASSLSVPEFPAYLQWMLEKTKAHGLVFGLDWNIASNTVAYPVGMHPGVLPVSHSGHIDQAISVVRENYPENKHTEKYLSYLQNLKGLIGTRRDPKVLAQAREWYIQQGRLKNKDYFSIFPVLNEILA